MVGYLPSNPPPCAFIFITYESVLEGRRRGGIFYIYPMSFKAKAAPAEQAVSVRKTRRPICTGR